MDRIDEMKDQTFHLKREKKKMLKENQHLQSTLREMNRNKQSGNQDKFRDFLTDKLETK